MNDDLEQLQVWAQLQNGYYTKIHATPSRAMTTDEVVAAVDEFRQAATRAMAAGFDGVEIHAANGYLPHQFLSSTLNRRDDRYGGSVANRARFLAEIVDAVGGVMPLGRVGVRISPYAKYNNVRDADPDATLAYVGRMLDDAGVAYLHAADTNGWSGEARPAAYRRARAPVIRRHADRQRRHFTGRGKRADRRRRRRSRRVRARLYREPRSRRAPRRTRPARGAENVGWYGGDRAGYVDYARHDAAESPA